tara:strand:+ start:371 stop:868 length:498 start_codon:yes stop_codon:yes gene_type:complete
MSTVILDTITGKSTATTVTIGSTPVVSASANSMTIRGEGSNQTSIQQGLLKHFVYIQGTDTFASGNSFNQSSATDHGTGDHSSTYTTNMGEARVPRVVYTHNTTNEGSSSLSGGNRSGTHTSGKGTVAPTTSAFRFDVYYGSSAAEDGASIDLSYLYMMTCGDLA